MNPGGYASDVSYFGYYAEYSVILAEPSVNGGVDCPWAEGG